MAEAKILLQKVTPIPRRKAGDLHFPRELVYLCEISFGADVEILAGQAATMVQTFERSCEMAAMKDDGKISRDEEKQLKKIKAAAQAFCKELEKAKNMN